MVSHSGLEPAARYLPSAATCLLSFSYFSSLFYTFQKRIGFLFIGFWLFLQNHQAWGSNSLVALSFQQVPASLANNCDLWCRARGVW